MQSTCGNSVAISINLKSQWLIDIHSQVKLAISPYLEQVSFRRFEAQDTTQGDYDIPQPRSNNLFSSPSTGASVWSNGAR